MVSPVPKHIFVDESAIPAGLRDHVCDVNVDLRDGVKIPGSQVHRAKYAPGLATALVRIAGTEDVGDPMAGVGTLAYETGLQCKLNDLDLRMATFLSPLLDRGCTVSHVPADRLEWRCDTLIFSPPYYPRTDRRRPGAHDDLKRGAVVGFRDSYGCDDPDFIGDPAGADGIELYRRQMTKVYARLASRAKRMIVVTKNWTRLGVELRLDWDTINMAQSVGWRCVRRHGFTPPASLWSRFNRERGTRQGRVGMVSVEDILLFERGSSMSGTG